jgi:hypothetical protein
MHGMLLALTSFLRVTFLVFCFTFGMELGCLIAVAQMVLVLHHFYSHFSDSGSGYSLIALATDIP